MLSCTYCKERKFDIGRGSLEHAILSSLGGKISSRNICCEICNNKFSNTIDNELAKQFKYFCTSFGIKTGRNKPAAKMRKILKSKSLEFDLLPDGYSQLSENKIEEKFSEKGIEISIVAKDAKNALNLLSGMAKKHNVPLTSLLPERLISINSVPEKFNFEFILNNSSMRCIAKMALTYAAMSISPERLRDGNFSQIIDFIKGVNAVNKFVGIALENNFPRIRGEENIDHRIMFVARASQRRAVCLIELFGNVRFSVILNSNWEGGDIAIMHTINPRTGSKRKHVLEISSVPLFSADFLPLSKGSQEIANGIDNLNRIIKREQRDRLLEEMLLASFSEAKRSNRNLTEKELHEGVENFKNKLRAYISGEDILEEIEVPPFQVR